MDREMQIAIACGFNSIDEARKRMGPDFDRFVSGDIVKDINPQILSIVESVKAVKWPMVIDVTAQPVDDARLESGEDRDG